MAKFQNRFLIYTFFTPFPLILFNFICHRQDAIVLNGFKVWTKLFLDTKKIVELSKPLASLSNKSGRQNKSDTTISLLECIIAHVETSFLFTIRKSKAEFADIRVIDLYLKLCKNMHISIIVKTRVNV